MPSFTLHEPLLRKIFFSHFFASHMAAHAFHNIFFLVFYADQVQDCQKLNSSSSFKIYCILISLLLSYLINYNKQLLYMQFAEQYNIQCKTFPYEGTINIDTYTIMLLMGMWISFTKKPMKPMIAKPIAVAMEIFWNSLRSGLVQRLRSLIESLVNCWAGLIMVITWSMVLEQKKFSSCAIRFTSKETGATVDKY